MTSPLQFPGLDGLMLLSRREGVDIRPTLLRVLTDLYVQTDRHTADEERQYVELASRLIDQVDDATRAAVRARLSIYPGTPPDLATQLGLTSEVATPAVSDDPATLIEKPAAPIVTPLSMQPNDASEVAAMFQRATSPERALILRSLADAPLRPSARIPASRAARAIVALEAAALARDTVAFTRELSDALILPAQAATQIVADRSGEPLACAAKALGMSAAVFQRVLLFLTPEIGSSVMSVYRLSRLYDGLSERAALIMLAAWRGATVAAARARYKPSLHDGERQRARAASAQPLHPAVRPGSLTPSRSSGER